MRARRPGGAILTRLTGEQTHAITAVLQQDRKDMIAAMEARQRPEPVGPAVPPTYAGDKTTNREGAPGQGPTAPIVIPPEPVLGQTMYFAQVKPDETALRSLLEALISAATKGKAQFEALGGSVPEPVSLDPDAVLWWGQPSASWAPRLRVPIIIQTSP